MKKELRQHLRDKLAAISTQEWHERSIAACNLLLAQPEYKKSEILMIYLSMSHEVDTAQIALQSWRDIKRVLAPRVNWEQRRMLPIEINSLTSDIREGNMGIREPLEGMPIPVFDIDLVVVPGLGFDERGNRLGRGRGFYDRFLSHRDFRGISCGLALEDQMIDEVPAFDLDVRVDMLVTDLKVRRFSSRTAKS